MAVFVNGEKEVSAWGEADSNNILAMGEWQGMGFVAIVSN
jgi:hypothetical protein